MLNKKGASTSGSARGGAASRQRRDSEWFRVLFGWRSTGCGFRSCACVAIIAPQDSILVSRVATGVLPTSTGWTETSSKPPYPCDRKRCLESEWLLGGGRSAPVAPGRPGSSVEDGVFSVVETGAPEFDGPPDLDVFAFPGDGDFRRMTHPAPGRVEGRILAEAGFVGKD